MTCAHFGEGEGRPRPRVESSMPEHSPWATFGRNRSSAWEAIGEGAQVCRPSTVFLGTLQVVPSRLRGRVVMSKRCTHLNSIRDATPSALGC